MTPTPPRTCRLCGSAPATFGPADRSAGRHADSPDRDGRPPKLVSGICTDCLARRLAESTPQLARTFAGGGKRG